jgi:hypothetical protein
LGDQAASQVACFGGEFAVCQRAENGRLILQYGQMQTVGMAGRMPFQNLDQGLCFACSGHRRKSRSLLRLESNSFSRGTGLFQRQYKIMNGFGLADSLSR